MSQQTLYRTQCVTKRIVVTATLAVAASHPVAALMRQCATAMKRAASDANLIVSDVDTGTDLKGSLVVGSRLVGDRRRIGMALTGRFADPLDAVALQGRCEARVAQVLASSSVGGTVVAYLAEASNGVAALASFR